MANDRIWIRCTVCGEQYLLTKYYPSTNLGDLYSPETLVDWLKQHLRERQERGIDIDGFDLNKNPGFEFCTDDPITGA